MGNAEQKNVKRKLDELKRITGLSFHTRLCRTQQNCRLTKQKKLPLTFSISSMH